jgi:hypothetical protein
MPTSTVMASSTTSLWALQVSHLPANISNCVSTTITPSRLLGAVAYALA